MGKTIAAYAGSFMPWHLGHQSIYDKAKRIFDEVWVILAKNPLKAESPYNREKMQKQISLCTDTYVFITDGLIAKFCKEHGIYHYVRGLRNQMDYAYEEEIAKVNNLVFPELETIYFRANNDAISSSMIRTLQSYGEDVSPFLPKEIDLGRLVK